MKKIIILFISLQTYAQDSYWRKFIQDLCLEKRKVSEEVYLKCLLLENQKPKNDQVFKEFVWSWVSDQYVRSENNCYNYATGKKTYSFAKPGRGGGKKILTMSCRDRVGFKGLVSAVLSDGLYSIDKNEDCLLSERKVALFSSGPKLFKVKDFHLYVETPLGLWAHKHGHEAPSFIDSKGRVIRDPEKAAKPGLKRFCGYFCSNPSEVEIK